jgi:hypothetical protein
MVTALLILAAVLVLMAFVGVLIQSVQSPFMWCYYTMTGAAGTLAELFGKLVVAIIEGFSGSGE